MYCLDVRIVDVLNSACVLDRIVQQLSVNHYALDYCSPLLLLKIVAVRIESNTVRPQGNSRQANLRITIRNWIGGCRLRE